MPRPRLDDCRKACTSSANSSTSPNVPSTIVRSTRPRSPPSRICEPGLSAFSGVNRSGALPPSHVSVSRLGSPCLQQWNSHSAEHGSRMPGPTKKRSIRVSESAPSPPMYVLELKLLSSAAASSCVMSGCSRPSGPAEARVALLGMIGGGNAELLALGEKPNGGRGARRRRSIA